MRRRADNEATDGPAGGDRRSRWWICAAALLAMTFAAGCGDDVEEADLDPDEGATDAEVDLDVDVEMADEIGEIDGYSRPDYSGQRNPFRPDTEYLDIEEDPDDEVADVGPTDPLEQYDLANLDLVTIISQTAVPRAMFIAPGGMGHFANEGDGIGTEGGVISAIRPDEVEVREGDGEDASITTVALRERQLTVDESDGLTQEERELLQELLEEEGQDALGEEELDEEEIDERFQGLAPPGEQ